MFISGTTFTDTYISLVDAVHMKNNFVSAPRNQVIKESLGVMFEIADPRDRLLFVPARKFSIGYLIAEALWYFLGENRTEWISNYAKFWEDISDDGETANSAYGARIFKPHNYIADGLYTQWDYIKEELTRDKHSRRAVIHIRLPEDSVNANKDVPCTLALQFFIRKDRLSDEDKLYMITHMRSSDLVLGISYDVPAFTMFQEFLANELGVALGTYKHVSNSLHVYERHFEMCDKILSDARNDNTSFVSQSMPPMPKEIPVDTLNTVQWDARKCESPEALAEVMNQWRNSDIDSYWKDWGWILIRHRAQKLKFDFLVKRCTDEIHFEGYKRFLK